VDAETLENVYWLHSENPPGHDIQLVFRSGAALDSVEVKRNNADGTRTSLMKMDQYGVEAAPPYWEFLDLRRS
jgi:hypothetical protein